ncbi:LpqB family beta-propeller domain-containing protein [Nocardiopsis ansamitocini]|uniref:Lipoprotein LpqB n=1 Tax=Nocardiopsis ansamitocini TaxID=1670832 RepID=A0A9W6UKE8_9ACTN|nr:LpqB family beta-propeller domain-containing protein [Nocardiopsis ansamitocini]GLU49667.1 lipoprotein LpqB [Nocardiopsis ansamitocini]
MSKNAVALRTTAWAACLVTLVAGCATVPTGGPPFSGRGDDAAGQVDTFTRLLPAGPQPGVDEKTLVRGFLKDMGSFEEDYKAARLYMTSDEQVVWKPSSQVLVYEEDDVALDVETGDDGESAKVRMRAAQVATIGTDGQYVAAGEGESVDTVFDLVQVEEGWRISDLPDELLLSRRAVDRVYRPLNLYYFNRDESTLVPDPVFLPVQPTSDVTEQLSRMLARMLVDGPTDWLAPAVHSAFPEGTRADVSYDSGRVTVALSPEADGVDAEARWGMSAQLVWTLRQLPEIQELILSIDGDESELAGEGSENLQANSETWSGVNPSGTNGQLRSYFMREGVLWSLDSNQQEARTEGAPGTGATPLELHAVSLAEDRVAGIAPGGNSVQVASLNEGSEYTTVLDGADYASLSWDGYGNLWVLEDPSDARAEGEALDDTEPGDPPVEEERRPAADSRSARIWLLPDGGDPVEVDIPELRSQQVTKLQVSRDGTRVAILTEVGGEGRVSVGRIVYDESGVSAQGFLPLASDIDNVTDLSWRGADQLAVLGQKARGALQAYLVPINGSADSTSAGVSAGSDMTSIAAGPGQPLLSGTEEDYIFMSSDRLMWRKVADGTNPVYPG